MYHFVLFSLTPSKIGHHLCTFSNHNSYLISKNVRTPKAFASQLFSLERILYETWNWLLTFLTTFLASNAGTDTPGSNKGHSDISDIIERNLFIYLHFVFVQLLFFSKSIVLALSCKTYQTIHMVKSRIRNFYLIFFFLLSRIIFFMFI